MAATATAVAAAAATTLLTMATPQPTFDPTGTAPMNTIGSPPSSASTDSPEQDKKSKFIAMLVALGILGFYAVLAIISLIIWGIRRCLRKPAPEPSYLPQEAPVKDSGAFLAPTQPQQKPGRKHRPRDITTASVHSSTTTSSSSRSPRSLFYEGPGRAHSRQYSASSTNLIPLRSPALSPVHTPDGAGVYGQQQYQQQQQQYDDSRSVRSGAGRSRSNSTFSSGGGGGRGYHYGYSADELPDVPTLPSIALTAERARGGWV